MFGEESPDGMRRFSLWAVVARLRYKVQRFLMISHRKGGWNPLIAVVELALCL